MRKLLSAVVFLSTLTLLLSSGLVSYSFERGVCPGVPQREATDEEIMAAHGLTQANYSIWLKEHSVGRNCTPVPLTIESVPLAGFHPERHKPH
ncbi:MAG: hypothetical protein ABSG42_00745 [Nitrospirota bacterium]